MSDIPFKMIDEYEGAPLYLMSELVSSGNIRGCAGCCFEAEYRTSQDAGCRHAGTLSCGVNHTICVRNLDDYKIAAVTWKFVGESK